MSIAHTSRQSAGAVAARPATAGKALLALALVSAWPTAAEETRSLAISAGVFNVSKSETSVEAGVEYRVPIGTWGLTAAGGLSGTEDGAIYIFGGLRRDIRVADGWWLTPALGLALYDDGDGKDLGGPVEFRSAIELSYEWPKRYRLAVAIYHLSNAGIYDLNPGANSLILTYSFPLRR